jgi:tetratricopeptide (TPR) repeat protein
MRFQKAEYERAQRIKRTITTVTILFISIIAFSLLKKSPDKNKPEPVVANKKITNFIKKNKNNSINNIPDLPTIVKNTVDSIVQITTLDQSGKETSTGTGFIIDKKGYIISSNHVMAGADSARIKTAYGNFEVHSFLLNDTSSDIVLLKINSKNRTFKSLKINSTLPEIGEKIFVIGNPLGLEATVSDGIVSARRNIKPFGQVIQITCPISPGSSGSPVMNMKGEVVGIATFQFVRGQNLNFAVPIGKAKKLLAKQGKSIQKLDTLEKEIIEGKDPSFEKGLVFFNKKDYRNARPYFESATNNDPMNDKAHYYLGFCLSKENDIRAIEEFKQAIGITPNYLQAHYELGNTYVSLNMKEEALECFKMALDINPNFSEAALKIGIVYTLMDRFKSAINHLESIANNSDNPKAHYYLGFCYSRSNRVSDAIFSFQRAVEIDPEYVQAYISLGAALALVRNWKLGLKYMKKARMLAPQNPEIHFIMGLLYYGNEDLASAEIQLETLKKLKAYKYRNKLSEAINSYKFNKKYRRY